MRPFHPVAGGNIVRQVLVFHVGVEVEYCVLQGVLHGPTQEQKVSRANVNPYVYLSAGFALGCEHGLAVQEAVL